MDVDIVSPPTQASLLLPPGPTGERTKLALEFRWGISAAELRALWLLHEHQFPSSYYDAEYYRHLCDGRYGVLGAYATKEGYQAAYEQRVQAYPDEAALAAAAEAQTAAHTVNRRSAARHHRSCQEIYAGQFPPLLDTAQAETWAGINTVVEEELYVMEQKAKKAAETAGDGAAAAAAAPATPYVQLVGVVVALLGYAEHTSGHLLTNPTCYIGSIAVDPILQSWGLGKLLLDRFTDDVFHKLPLHASRYLHYDEQRMLRLVKESAAAAKEGPAAGPAAAPKAAEESEGLLMTFARFFAPSFATWLEDVQARQALRAAGVPEAEIAAQRHRDTTGELTPAEQALVDPVVQTGVREVFLHCLADEAQLVAFYERYGFTLLRTIPGYYPMPDGSSKTGCLLVLPAGKATGGLGPAGEDLSHTAKKKQQEVEARISRRHRAADTPAGEGKERKEGQGEEGTEQTTVRVKPLWLTDDVYGEVRNINLSAVENCRYFFQKRKAATTWQDRVQEFVFGANAVVAIVLIIWWFYYKILPWLAGRRENRHSGAAGSGGGRRWFGHGSADL